MAWQSVTLPATADEAERLSDALMEAGALSVSIEDAAAGTVAEAPIFGEPGMPTDALWRDNKVLALFAHDANVQAILAEAAHASQFELPSYQIEPVPEQDWVRLTQAEFDPIHISERLWIIPQLASAARRPGDQPQARPRPSVRHRQPPHYTAMPAMAGSAHPG